MIGVLAKGLNSRYDRGGTFGLKLFVNGGVPYAKIVGNKTYVFS